MKSQIKSIFISFVMIISFITNLSAAWIEREPIQLVQPNGDRVRAFVSGDEFHNWIHDAEGFTIVKDNITSQYCWAIIENDELVSSGYPINQYMARSIGLEPFLNISEEAYREKRREWDENFQNNHSSTPKTGEAHNIVIFITFRWGPNYDLEKHGDAIFNDPFSVYEDNFLDLNTYFWDASYQQLDVSSSFYPIQHGSNVVSYLSEKERHYYTLEGAGYNSLLHRNRCRNLLREAIADIEDMVPISLNIDRDNDGFVDNVIFIIEGRRELASGAGSSFFWPSKGTFTELSSDGPPPTIHNKTVRNYNVILENSHLDDNEYTHFRFIHILHEFAHSLGADDLYSRSTPDLRYDPVGPWCLMARAGSIVSSISSIVKHRDLGWIDVPTITTSGNYTLNPLASQQNNVAFRINSPYSESQYFLVEYRRKVAGKFPDSNLSFHYGSNINIPDPHGLIVYRVIDGGFTMDQFRVYAYRPDEISVLYGSYNAFFSVDTGRTAINDLTNPKSFIYELDGETFVPGGLNISNIGFAGDTISFNTVIPNLTLSVYVDPINYGVSPNTYQTIQGAVNAVHNGGTIFIYPHPNGAYSGVGNREIVLPFSKLITITSMYENQRVVIDCENNEGFVLKPNNVQFKINNLKIINSQNAIQANVRNVSLIIDNVIFDNTGSNLLNSRAINIGGDGADYAESLIISNCEFIGFTNSAIFAKLRTLSIQNSAFKNNSGETGSSIIFLGRDLHLESNLFQNNIGSKNGANLNLGASYLLISTQTIYKNMFVDNHNLLLDTSTLPSVNISISSANNIQNLLISSNIFKQNAGTTNNAPNINISGFSTNSILSASYINNSEIGFGHGSNESLRISVGSLPVEIKNSIFTGRIQAGNSSNKTISNSWFFDIENPDTEVNLNTMITGILPNNRHDLFTGNPHLDMETLRPIWNSQFKSGLINNGHRDTNGDGIFWWNDPKDSDPDNTRLDIGAVHYQHGIIKHWIFPPFLSHQEQDYIIQPRSVESIEWLAFPYLDKMYAPPNFPYAQAGYVFGPHNDNNLFGQNEQNEDFLESISWNFNNDQGVISR
ncbi:MAG: hypothetical protein FWG98_14410, partial [Candidatus Cloacimonetes bacterium]|nr:hypothetical protein [Candidatus Cloacimonadota bacterium]